MNITDQLVEFSTEIEWKDIPASVMAVQKRTIADMVSVMIGATGMSESAAAFARMAVRSGTGRRCTLFARPEKVNPGMAALANGALTHALDYEDAHKTATCHSNSASIPALLALAEEKGGCSGREFMLASLIASEVGLRLDVGLNEDLLKYGFNMPPIHASMGAVFGCGRLMGHTREQIRDAIALNMCQNISPGEAGRSRFSVVRTVREAFGAQAAVNSTLLAAEGIVARFEEPLEGKLGYYHMFARDNYTPERVVKDLGSYYWAEGTDLKPWPTCRATHTSIELLQKIMTEHHLKEDDVESVRLVMSDIARMVFEPAVQKYAPEAAAIARFSMPFVLGTTAVYGDVDLDSFSQERLHDPKILQFGKKVSYSVDPSLTKEQNKVTTMTVKTREAEYTEYLDTALGSDDHPMGEERIRRKFLDCFAHAGQRYARERVEKIIETVLKLDELEDIRDLTGLIW